MVAVKKNFMLEYYASLRCPERLARGVRWRWEIWDDVARVGCPFISTILPKPSFYLDEAKISKVTARPWSYPVACARQSRTSGDKFYTNENALPGKLEHGLCSSTAVDINSLTMLP
jgi:hypothetical protein